MPPPSASASGLAAHWVADALSGDVAVDFFALKALVDASPDSFVGAPEATRERVALRCLQEVVAAAAGVEAAAAPGRVLRIDATRSCEDVLFELIQEVGGSGSLEKDKLVPFSQDIHKFICIKKPAFAETSFELLREVFPEITSMLPPFPAEQNCNNKHDNDQSLCNVSDDHVNIEKHGGPSDSGQLQKDNSTNLVNETDPRNLQKDPMESAPDFRQPCAADSGGYNHDQDTIAAVGSGVRSPEKTPNSNINMSVAAEPASASRGACLLGSNTEPLSKKDVVDHTAVVQPQSCGDKYPNPPQYSDREEPHNDATSIQLSKNPIHKGPIMPATAAPVFGRNSDALPRNTSETRRLSEFITAESTTVITEPHSRKNNTNLPEHDSSEKVIQDLDDGNARAQLVGKDPSHYEPTLRTSAGLPSVSCDVAIQGDTVETNHQPETSEHTKTFQQRNVDMAHREVRQALYDDLNNLKKSAVCGGQTGPESGCCRVDLTEQAANDSAEDFTEQALCVKCGEDGQLLKCSSCLLAAHNSCFGSLVIFEDFGQFDCPVCFYNKATVAYGKAKKTYSKAKDNLSAFLGTKQLGKQRGERSAGVQRRTDNRDDHLNGSNLSERQASHQSEEGNLSHMDEEPGRQRNKQQINATRDACHEDVVNGKISFSRNSDVAPLNKRCVLLSNGERPTVVQQRAAKSVDHLDVRNSSKRQASHQSEADYISHNDEEPGQQRKKQKTNAASGACAEDAVIEKAPFGQNSDDPNMSKHCVVQNSRKQVHVTEHEQPLDNAEPGQQKTNATSEAVTEKASYGQNYDNPNMNKHCVLQNNRKQVHVTEHEQPLGNADPGQQRKKQKTNGTSYACPEEAVTEKASFGQNYDNPNMNKHCVLQKNRKQVHFTEHEQPVENIEAREEAANVILSDGTNHPSQNRCSPVANQNIEANKDGGLTNSHQSENSDEIETASSSDFGEGSSSPSKNMRHHKIRFQEKHRAVSSKSKISLGRQDQNMPSPSRKRNYAYPAKRYSNPIAPTGRRNKLCWTEEEEVALREAMAKFTPKDNGCIPWTEILESGRGVFHMTRQPPDLRSKWRIMNKKSGS